MWMGKWLHPESPHRGNRKRNYQMDINIRGQAGESSEAHSTGSMPDNGKNSGAGAVQQVSVAAASCCSQSEQAVCCEPAAKASCCGNASSGGCGCR